MTAFDPLRNLMHEEGRVVEWIKLKELQERTEVLNALNQCQ